MTTTVLVAAPCARCPFRMDVPIYLRQDWRAEIAETLLNGGGEFPCHKTVRYDEDDDGTETPDESHAQGCAGAVKALLAVGGTTQMMRFAERLDHVNLDEATTRGADCWDLDTWVQLAEGATADNPEEIEVETCNTVNDGCLAPAGFLGSSGGVLSGTVAADGECPECGEPVCSECADDLGLCGDCTEDDDE